MKKLIRSIFKIKIFELTAKRLTNNKKPTSFIGKLIPQNKDYNINTYRFVKRNKINFIIDLSDYIGHYFYYGFKDISHEKLIELIKKDYTVIDVGVNIGITLLQIASKTNEKVYGFEPHPQNHIKAKKKHQAQQPNKHTIRKYRFRR